MLTYESLRRDVDRRIERVQNMMRVRGLDALVIVGAGAPGALGCVRYLTNAHLWSGCLYVVLDSDDPQPWVQIESPYQAVWTRRETTTDPARVEASGDVVARTAQLARKCARRSKRIGIVNGDRLLSVGQHQKLTAALRGYEVLEVTEAYNAIRRIKSPFELEAMQENGAIVDASLDVFRAHARVGARYWEVCAVTEAFLKSKGAFWGRTKLSLDLTPYTVPPPRDREMMETDVINFEIVYESQWGYWVEMTAVFSFGELPEEAARLLAGYLEAVEHSSAIAKPGNTLGAISEENDDTLRALGFAVTGKHTPDCHSIGLGSDGPSSVDAPEFVLEPNMVLSFHPGTVLAGNRGFLISDNFLVTSEGAFRLSPHTAGRYHLFLTG